MDNDQISIGKTPLHEIESRLINPYKDKCKILLKLENENPTKSIKDRMIQYIISDVQKHNSSISTFVTASSGNTGTSLSFFCNKKGYNAIVVTNTKCSSEKIEDCKKYGAEVLVTDSTAKPNSEKHYQMFARNIANSNEDYFDIDQYSNPKNSESYYKTLGPEIWTQSKGLMTHFVTGGSTCGTIMGVGKYLKEKNKDILLVLADPKESVISNYVLGREINSDLSSYVIEGVGKDSIPKLIDKDIIDSVIQVTDQKAIEMCYRLRKYENLNLGGSSGLNVSASVSLASTLPKGSVIVTIACDSGEKYESKIYNNKWLSDNSFSLN